MSEQKENVSDRKVLISKSECREIAEVFMWRFPGAVYNEETTLIDFSNSPKWKEFQEKYLKKK